MSYFRGPKNDLFEILSVSTIAGGTIVVPHLRRTVEYWNELEMGREK
jgi:hypothetical protein